MVFTSFYHQTWGFPWFSWTLSHRPILGLSANSTLESSSCATTSDLVLDGSGMATELMLDSLGVPPNIINVITCYQHGSTPNEKIKKPRSWALPNKMSRHLIFSSCNSWSSLAYPERWSHSALVALRNSTMRQRDGVKSAGIPRIHYIKKEDYMRLITYIYVYIYNIIQLMGIRNKWTITWIHAVKT